MNKQKQTDTVYLTLFSRVIFCTKEEQNKTKPSFEAMLVTTHKIHLIVLMKIQYANVHVASKISKNS